jgi:hypothetical protein
MTALRLAMQMGLYLAELSLMVHCSEGGLALDWEQLKMTGSRWEKSMVWHLENPNGRVRRLAQRWVHY